MILWGCTIWRFTGRPDPDGPNFCLDHVELLGGTHGLIERLDAIIPYLSPEESIASTAL